MHVAIIMDGNGRWATAKGLPRAEGHRAGALAVRRAVEAALAQRIGVLTLFAFSSENWHRPSGEVEILMRLFGEYLREQGPALAEHGVRFRLIGRRERLGGELLGAVREAEERTAAGGAMRLRIAIDYSGRDAILRAAGALLAARPATAGGGRARPASAACKPARLGDRRSAGQLLAPGRAASGPSREEFARLLGSVEGERESAPDVDLLIRTGGERRLSDFFLWECAFAELVFLGEMWPDFTAAGLASALAEYRSRQRRFGRLPEQVAL
jgi:undecaprenyl diphosphate synthase